MREREIESKRKREGGREGGRDVLTTDPSAVDG